MELLLSFLGYEKKEMQGLRVRFVYQKYKTIMLHRQHPENHIKGGALKDVKRMLKEEGVL
ncbi:hypothetical protein [Candidatus Erwinia dacicola]|nr:hypothetical protein [Candidatus Erwinia dacicola]RAP69506.1 hicA domain protein [Candidatus Erwinia dacicola]